MTKTLFTGDAMRCPVRVVEPEVDPMRRPYNCFVLPFKRP